MPDFFWKWRKEIVFTLLVVLSLGMLVSQREPGMMSRTLRQGVAFVVVPLQKASASVIYSGRTLVNGLVSMRTLRQQNTAYARQTEKLTLENNLLREQARENDILRQQLDYRKAAPWRFIPAAIIGRDPASWMERAVLECGATDGVRAGAGVITPEGVAGRIIDTTLSSSTVMMLTDSQSSVAGMVERSKIAGTVKGVGKGWLKLMYVANDEDVKVGDVVTTSRLSSLFPPGLPIGDVVSVAPSDNGLMLDVKVRPRINFRICDRFLILQAEK